jgi:hypothetical protein
MSTVDATNGRMQSFSGVPTLDFALLNGQKTRFLAELRHILVNVGFLYLENPPIDKVSGNLGDANDSSSTGLEYD